MDKFMKQLKSNRLPPMVNPKEFNKNKVSNEYLKLCKKAGKLFKHHEYIIFVPEETNTTNQCDQNNKEKDNVENL